MEEFWKQIKGCRGFYSISNKGRVRSCDRTFKDKDGEYVFVKGTILKNCMGGNGYYRVGLSVMGIRKDIYIHRLLAEHFIEKPDIKTEVNHINGDKLDNNLNNLEWVTRGENIAHAYRLGLRKFKHVDQDKHKLNKKVLQYDLEGNFIKSYPSVTIAENDNSLYNISKVCLHKRRSVGGYSWEFEN